jgi:hypothetical protein
VVLLSLLVLGSIFCTGCSIAAAAAAAGTAGRITATTTAAIATAVGTTTAPSVGTADFELLNDVLENPGRLLPADRRAAMRTRVVSSLPQSDAPAAVGVVLAADLHGISRDLHANGAFEVVLKRGRQEQIARISALRLPVLLLHVGDGQFSGRPIDVKLKLLDTVAPLPLLDTAAPLLVDRAEKAINTANPLLSDALLPDALLSNIMDIRVRNGNRSHRILPKKFPGSQVSWVPSDKL